MKKLSPIWAEDAVHLSEVAYSALGKVVAACITSTPAAKRAISPQICPPPKQLKLSGNNHQQTRHPASTQHPGYYGRRGPSSGSSNRGNRRGR